MTQKDISQLEQKVRSLTSGLPSHRGEWSSLLLQNHDWTLAMYDSLTLGGTPAENEAGGINGYTSAQIAALSSPEASHDETYRKLVESYRVSGDDRRGFYLGARTALNYLHDRIIDFEPCVPSATLIASCDLPTVRKTLNDLYNQYRAVFQFMIDRISEARENLSYLEGELSPERAGYTREVLDRKETLFELFDRVVLHGYSDERESQLNPSDEFHAVMEDSFIFKGEEGRPVYEQLSRLHQSLPPEEREGFHYGMRRAFQTLLVRFDQAQGRVTEMATFQELPSKPETVHPPSLHDAISRVTVQETAELRGISSGLRDVYRVMVDIVKQSTNTVQ